MHIATDPHNLPLAPRALARGCAVTIGNFDGVHHGHQQLIRRTIEKAREAGLPAVVITFTPHPLRVVLDDKAPPMLMSLRNKLARLADLGVDLTLVMHFTKETAASTPEEFVKDVLVDCLNTKELVVGYDYAFGKGRRGNAQLLAELGTQYGFAVEQLQPVYLDGGIVSSTRIRNALGEGDVATAARLLGRAHSVDGLVVHGANRGGKLLGFPTANLQADDDLMLPKPGVYAVLAELGEYCAENCAPSEADALADAEIQPETDPGAPENCGLPAVLLASKQTLLDGVANVGKNPTFGDAYLRVETHLLNFHRDIYNHRFRVYFIERLRDERKFDGVTALMEQINRDAEQAKDILAGFHK